MKRLIVSALVVATILCGGIASWTSQSALAVDPKSSAKEGLVAAGDDGTTTIDGGLKSISDILLFVLGAICVIVIIVGGIRYATSGGDSGQIKSAKDTILYAVIGLVVALLAYAIVRFVLSNIK